MVLACVAIGLSGLPGGVRGLLMLGALAYGAASLRRFARPAFHRIAFGRAGWALVGRDGTLHGATLRAQRRVGVLLALDFSTDTGKRFTPILLPDNADAETRRRLVLILARGEVATSHPVR